MSPPHRIARKPRCIMVSRYDMTPQKRKKRIEREGKKTNKQTNRKGALRGTRAGTSSFWPGSILHLRDDGQSDSSLGVLEQSDSLLVSLALEERRIDSVDLIARPQFRLGGRSSLKDRLDEDGEVALRVAESADDAETQSVGSSLQNDASVGRRSRRCRCGRHCYRRHGRCLFQL